MAPVTWPPLVTAAPISSSVKVARARPGTAAARRPMRVARTGGTETAVVDIGRSRRGGWRGRAPQHPPQPVAPTIARTAPATPPRSRARARPCKLQPSALRRARARAARVRQPPPPRPPHPARLLHPRPALGPLEPLVASSAPPRAVPGQARPAAGARPARRDGLPPLPARQARAARAAPPRGPARRRRPAPGRVPPRPPPRAARPLHRLPQPLGGPVPEAARRRPAALRGPARRRRRRPAPGRGPARRLRGGGDPCRRRVRRVRQPAREGGARLLPQRPPPAGRSGGS